jgi:hyperosmotically inducible protein
MLVTSLTAVTAVTGLTGCSTWQQKTSERSEGRMVDDRKIASNIKSELRAEPVYKFSDVGVRTFNGVVQLNGFVNTEEQKRRAGEIAQSVPGVVQVENNISLKSNSGYTPTGRNTGNQNYNNTTPAQSPTTPPRNNNSSSNP